MNILGIEVHWGLVALAVVVCAPLVLILMAALVGFCSVFFQELVSLPAKVGHLRSRGPLTESEARSLLSGCLEIRFVCFCAGLLTAGVGWWLTGVHVWWLTVALAACLLGSGVMALGRARFVGSLRSGGYGPAHLVRRK